MREPVLVKLREAVLVKLREAVLVKLRERLLRPCAWHRTKSNQLTPQHHLLRCKTERNPSDVSRLAADPAGPDTRHVWVHQTDGQSRVTLE